MQSVKTPSSPANSIQALIERGLAAVKNQRFEEAEACCQNILRQNPDHPEANSLMGMLRAQAKQTSAAITFFKRAVAGNPDNLAYRNNLGLAYLMANKPELAVAELEWAVNRQPDSYACLYNLGRAYRKLNQADRGIPHLEKAVRLQPEVLEAKIALADSLTDLGRMDEAAKLCREILAQKPDFVGPLAALALNRKVKAGDPEILEIEKRLASGRLNEAQLEILHHMAGKSYDDIKDYDRAFVHFEKGKAIAAKVFSLSDYRRRIDNLIDTFTPDFFADRRAAFGISSEVPVFIVGMPRSGTTLTEQIAASHPHVYGAGELGHFPHMALALKIGRPDSAVRQLTAAASRELAGNYLREITKVGGDVLRIIDKMPHNFEYLGLIAVLFPKARIIHCTRDPMDNCVSCFVTKFSGNHGYNTDLRQLGLYYREYRRLMDHWRRVLPLPMLEVDYQEMIADQETQSRRLIDFLGLDWDPACLNFHETERSVQTASRWQVRQPIYKTSVKRWKDYEKHLGPLKEALGELAVD